MEYLATLLNLSVIHVLMAMVPGPNTVVVSHSAARVSRGAGLLAALGVAAASSVWVALSLAGIGVLLLEAGAVYAAARLIGACYLAYLGIRMLRARPVVVAPHGGRSARRQSPFTAGLLTTLSNPKSAAFWTSVFALVVPGQAPPWFYCAVATTIALQSLAWYGFVALALSTAVARDCYAGLASWLDRLAGAVLVLLGLRLADDLRRELSLQAP